MKQLRIKIGDKTYDVEVEELGGDSASAAPSRPARPRAASVAPAAAAPAPAPAAAPKAAAGDNSITSPLAAMVVSIDVEVGAQVNEGDNVITLEAMKMNTVVTAPKSGTIQAIHINAGDAVEEGQALAEIA